MWPYLVAWRVPTTPTDWANRPAKFVFPATHSACGAMPSGWWLALLAAPVCWRPNEHWIASVGHCGDSGVISV